MAWTEKWQPTPLDNQPIPGLLFLDGDLLVRTREPDVSPDEDDKYFKRRKYPVIVFPSGVSADVSDDPPDSPVRVAILREMRLPVHDTRDSAYEKALTLLEANWRVEKFGEDALNLWLGNANDKHLRITYDNAEQMMVNMHIIEAVPTTTERLSLKEEITERVHHLPGDHILKAKDTLQAVWQQLLLDHQATTALVLLRELVNGSMGEWILGALSLLYLSPPNLSDELLVIPAVTLKHLEELGLTPEQRAALMDDDLEDIAHRMQEDYMTTVFWDKLALYTRRVLAEKQSPTD